MNVWVRVMDDGKWSYPCNQIRSFDDRNRNVTYNLVFSLVSCVSFIVIYLFYEKRFNRYIRPISDNRKRIDELSSFVYVLLPSLTQVKMDVIFSTSAYFWSYSFAVNFQIMLQCILISKIHLAFAIFDFIWNEIDQSIPRIRYLIVRSNCIASFRYFCW